MNKELAKAIAFASEVHKHHIDRGGMPYILHPIRVMQKVLERTNNDLQAGIVAVCHDCIEDGWPPDLWEKGFEIFSEIVTDNFEVINALELLTHNSKDDYFQYIRVISTNEIAKVVKIADIEDNSNIMRLKGLREKDFERLKKYHVSHCYLTGKTDKLLDLA